MDRVHYPDTLSHTGLVIGVRCVLLKQEKYTRPTAEGLPVGGDVVHSPNPPNRVTAISGRSGGRAGGRSVGRSVGRAGQILPKYLSGTGVCTSVLRSYRGPVCHQWDREKLSLERTTCLADKTNHPVERLSLNRSQCGSCSTKYDTSAGT